MESAAEDLSDPTSQKAAFVFFERGVAAWGALDGGLPGFERYIYEHLLPVSFKVPAAPQFNIKDGQMLVVRLFSSAL
jgi:exportin-T